MKNIHDVINIDTKWLMHFLKEKHLLKLYFNKMNENRIKPINTNYYDWLNHVEKNYEFYSLTFYENIIHCDFINILLKNTSLLYSIKLFNEWHGDYLIWKPLLNKYLEFKLKILTVNDKKLL